MTDETQYREIKSLWSIPGLPNERCVGTLTLKPGESPRLVLIIPHGHFHIPEFVESAFHGCDSYGKEISFLFPAVAGSKSGGAMTQVTITGAYAILGLHVKQSSDVRVNQLHLRMQHLQAWTGITGFIDKPSVETEELNICYIPPKPVVFPINADLSVTISSIYTLAHEASERRITEDVEMTFDSVAGLSWQEAQKIKRAVRQLIHFAFLKPVYPTAITATVVGSDGSLFPVEIFSSINREPVETELWSERWVFQFSDLESKFGEFLGRWFDYVEKHDEALGDYSTTIYHKLPPPVQHLCLTQALDAYHGGQFSSHNKQDYEKKIQEIAQLQKDTLKGIIDDPAEFAKTVVHNRNYYTHHNPKWLSKGRVVTGGDLVRLNEKLRLLFQTCVLADHGIPKDRFQRLRVQLATRIVDVTQ